MSFDEAFIEIRLRSDPQTHEEIENQKTLRIDLYFCIFFSTILKMRGL